jgi:hypothetical protein
MNAYQKRKYVVRLINGKPQIGVRSFTIKEVRELFDDSYVVIQRKYFTPCWEWTRLLHKKGYGVGIVYMGIRLSAHQLSWILNRGPIPDGLYVCHHCDNRKCINPDHLFIGDNDDNMDDAHEKGRCIGSGHWRAQLTDAEVTEMRRLRREEGLRYADLVTLFKVHMQTVAGIIRRERWKHIP